MRSNNFGMGFFGRRGFDFDDRKEYFEEWSKMSPKERAEEMDRRIDEMAAASNDMENFFGCDMRKHFAEKWANMSQEDKEEMMKNRDFSHGGFFGKNGFSTDSIDNFCEEWLKKTPEQKEEFIKNKKEAFHQRHAFMHGFFHGRGSRFGF